MPAPRRRTLESDIDDVRDDLLYNLQGVEHARSLIEFYVTPENIAHLEDDSIVPRLLRLTRLRRDAPDLGGRRAVWLAAT